jgi:hypothetical protein
VEGCLNIGRYHIKEKETSSKSIPVDVRMDYSRNVDDWNRLPARCNKGFVQDCHVYTSSCQNGQHTKPYQMEPSNIWKGTGSRQAEA